MTLRKIFFKYIIITEYYQKMSTFPEKLEPCKKNTVKCGHTQGKKVDSRNVFSVGAIVGFSTYFRALFYKYVQRIIGKYVQRITGKDNK